MIKNENPRNPDLEAFGYRRWLAVINRAVNTSQGEGPRSSSRAVDCWPCRRNRFDLSKAWRGVCGGGHARRTIGCSQWDSLVTHYPLLAYPFILSHHGFTTQYPSRALTHITLREGLHQTFPETLGLALSISWSQVKRMAVPVAHQTGYVQKPQTS